MSTTPEPLPPLDPQAVALLGLIHRHANGGPPAPPRYSLTFSECYAVLIDLDFIEYSVARSIWVLTESGNKWLRQRFASD